MTKKNLFKMGVMLALVCALAGLVGCSGSGETKKQDQATAQATASKEITTVNPGVITVGSDFSFPPFEYIEDNTKKGFSVELAQAVSEKMGMKIEWADPLKFDTLIALVNQKSKIDAAWASITINPTRQQEVDFTDPYLDSNQGAATLKNSGINSFEQLDVAGKKVAVQSGSTGEEWAKENLKHAEVLVLDDNVAGFAAMQAGQCDGVILDLPVIQWMVSSSYHDVQIIKEIPTGEQYGIAVSKDNPELTKKFNEALKAIKDDGTYQKIYDKYFKVD